MEQYQRLSDKWSVLVDRLLGSMLEVKASRLERRDTMAIRQITSAGDKLAGLTAELWTTISGVDAVYSELTREVGGMAPAHFKPFFSCSGGPMMAMTEEILPLDTAWCSMTELIRNGFRPRSRPETD